MTLSILILHSSILLKEMGVKRLNRVAKVLKDYGVRVQESKFEIKKDRVRN